MSREPRRIGGFATFLITLVILALIAASGYVIWLCMDLVNMEPEQADTNSSVELPMDATEATEAPTSLPSRRAWWQQQPSVPRATC